MCWYELMRWDIYYRITSLGQLYGWPNVRETTMKDMGKADWNSTNTAHHVYISGDWVQLSAVAPLLTWFDFNPCMDK